MHAFPTTATYDPHAALEIADRIAARYTGSVTVETSHVTAPDGQESDEHSIDVLLNAGRFDHLALSIGAVAVAGGATYITVRLYSDHHCDDIPSDVTPATAEALFDAIVGGIERLRGIR